MKTNHLFLRTTPFTHTFSIFETGEEDYLVLKGGLHRLHGCKLRPPRSCRIRLGSTPEAGAEACNLASSRTEQLTFDSCLLPDSVLFTVLHTI